MTDGSGGAGSGADRPARSPRLGVVGLGLIGGSLAQRAAELGLPVLGWSRSAETRAMAAEHPGLEVAESLAALLGSVDMVVLATPLPVLETTLDQVAAALRGVADPPTITDVGSVKAAIGEHARQVLDDPSIFVGGHPLAGTEHSGWDAADPALFDGTTWALAVDAPVDLDRLFAVADLVCRLGAGVVPVEAAEHDRTVALTSHLPYLLAAQFGQLMVAQGLGDLPLASVLAGGSIASLTRVVSSPSSARFAADLGFANRAALVEQIDRLVEMLLSARIPLQLGDQGGIDSLFGWRPRPGAGPEVEIDRPAERGDLVALGLDGGRIVSVQPHTMGVRRVRPAGSQPIGMPEQ